MNEIASQISKPGHSDSHLTTTNGQATPSKIANLAELCASTGSISKAADPQYSKPQIATLTTSQITDERYLIPGLQITVKQLPKTQTLICQTPTPPANNFDWQSPAVVELGAPSRKINLRFARLVTAWLEILCGQRQRFQAKSMMSLAAWARFEQWIGDPIWQNARLKTAIATLPSRYAIEGYASFTSPIKSWAIVARINLARGKWECEVFEVVGLRPTRVITRQKYNKYPS